MAEGGLDEYESWKCSKTAERLYCPPEGCPSAYGCAREKGWMSGMPSPPECQGSYPKVNTAAGAGPSADQHTAAMEAARRILDRASAIKRRPTIAELEVILQAPDPPPVTIKPDGSIGVGETDEVIVARALLASEPDPSLSQCNHPDCRTWRSKPCGEGCYWQPGEPDPRVGALREAWHQINGMIESSPLPGNGTDRVAQRNGLVLAANAVLALFQPEVGAFASPPRDGE